MIFFTDGMEAAINDRNWLAVESTMDHDWHGRVTLALKLYDQGPAERIPDCCDELSVIYAQEHNANPV